MNYDTKISGPGCKFALSASQSKSKNSKKEFANKEGLIYCSLNHPGPNDANCQVKQINDLTVN